MWCRLIRRVAKLQLVRRHRRLECFLIGSRCMSRVSFFFVCGVSKMGYSQAVERVEAKVRSLRL